MDVSRIAEFIVGSLPGIAAVGFFLHRIEKKFNVLMIEHEMLMGQYAKETGQELQNLPTRSRGPA